jgi:hypothetical protein
LPSEESDVPEAITVGGVDLGVAWKASIVSTDVDTILLEIRPDQPASRQTRFRTATSFVAGPHGDIFSTWPDGTNCPRWVLVVLSEAVHYMTLRDAGVERSISPVRIGAGRLPQIGIFSVTSHPAHLDLYGEGDEKLRLGTRDPAETALGRRVRPAKASGRPIAAAELLAALSDSSGGTAPTRSVATIRSA